MSNASNVTDSALKPAASTSKAEVRPYVAAARLSIKQGAWRDAAQIWDQLSDQLLEEWEPEWKLLFGRVLKNVGRSVEAESLLLALVDGETQAATRAMIPLAHLAAERKNYRTSVAWWRRLERRSATLRQERWIALPFASALQGAGHFFEADSVLEQLLNRHPDFEQGWDAFVKNAERQYNHDLASERRQRANEFAPKRHEIHQKHSDPNVQRSDQTEAHPFYSQTVHDAQTAYEEVRRLSSLLQRRDALSLARQYETRYPDYLDFKWAIVELLEGHISSYDDVTILQEVSYDLACRLPESRRAQLQNINAGVCLNDVAVVEERLNQIETRYGPGSDTLRIRGWIAMQNGDIPEARRLATEVENQHPCFALRVPIDPLASPDERRAPQLKNSILLFTVMRDERVFLPWFLQYYRSIGVDHFYIIDNGSSDGTEQYLSSQEDVSVFRTTGVFHRAADGMQWINHLIQKYGRDNWCVFVDADEQLILPEIEKKGLKQLLAGVAAKGEEVVGGYMLDTYPGAFNDVRNYGHRSHPLEHSPFIDPEHYFFGGLDSPWRRVTGGARARFFHIFERLHKAPIVWGGAALYTGNHKTQPAVPSTMSCVLLHHKILRDGLDHLATDASLESPRIRDRGPRCRSRHLHYRELFERDSVIFPTAESSLRYRDSSQLVELGLLRGSE